MLPVFANEKRRKINLGGQVSVQTHDSIVNQARARREEREDRRRQHESAVRIQAWWRGSREARSVRRELYTVFQRDPLSISGLRCLVLIGGNDQVLGTWSAAVVGSGEGTLPAAAIPVCKNSTDVRSCIPSECHWAASG
jgi:ubiquitin-protein ligase E3 C